MVWDPMTSSSTPSGRAYDWQRGQAVRKPRAGHRSGRRDPSGCSSRFATGVAFVYIVVTAVTPHLYGKYLAPLLVLALLWVLLRRDPIPTPAIGWALVLGGLGTFGTLHGFIRDNPGAWATTSIFIFEPILLCILFGVLYSSGYGVRRLAKTLDTALVCVALVGVFLYLSTSVGFSVPPWLVDPRHTAVDLSGSTLRTNYQGYNSLVFLAPYGVLRGLLTQADNPSLLRRAVILAAVVSGVVLSGRRALYLATPLGAILALAVLFLVRRRLEGSAPRRGRARMLLPLGFALAAMIGILNAIGLGVGKALSRTLGQITLIDPTGVRQVQFDVLIERWSQHPIIGHGAGAIVPGYIRNYVSPWTFEMTYNTILMDFGLVGLAVLAIWGGWTMLQLASAGARGARTCLAILAGMIGAALSATVDPYLFKIDGIWMVLAPFGVAAGAAQWARSSAAAHATELKGDRGG